MIVPNFVPEPLEIPGNVHTQPYDVRLRFIQRVNLFHVLSLVAVAAFANLPIPIQPVETTGAASVAAILLLSLVRLVFRRNPQEQAISLAVLPVVLITLGFFVQACHAAKWPVGWALAGALVGLFYTVAARRDFSFVGQFFVGWVVSSAGIGWLAIQTMPPSEAAVAFTSNTLFLLYCTHDRSQVMYRRRPGEEWGAVADLYRDPFNFLGYFARCIQHWRKHRIWSLPR